MVVQADLAELWRTPLAKGEAVGAVPRADAHFKYKRRVPTPGDIGTLAAALPTAPLRPLRPLGWVRAR